MKNRIYHILFSRILLICFIAGQVMVYAHQHNTAIGIVKTFGIAKDQQGPSFKEKCALCDVMHHHNMLTTLQVYFNPISTGKHVYQSVQYSFTSIGLILSGGRAPPVFNS